MVKLEIKGMLVLHIPAQIFLPCLKTLSLRGVAYGDNASARRLFSGCHVLEDLDIGRNEGDGMEFLCITVATLKRLSISSSSLSAQRAIFKIEINCPAVECFELRGGGWKEFTVKFSSSLLEAHVDSVCGFDLWKGIFHVPFLVVSHNVMPSLHSIYTSYSMPTLCNLVRVELHVGEFAHRDFLPSLLKSSPNLKVLIFPKGLVASKDYASGSRGFYWHKPQTVPECLISHLRIIEINNYVDLIREFYFVNYMLEFGEALEKIEIECCELGVDRKQELLHHLESIEKVSSSCELRILDPDTD